MDIHSTAESQSKSETPSIDSLTRLISAPSPSGFEQPAQEVFRTWAGQYADDIQTDILGNVYAVLNPGGNPRIMLAGHCDEIGFLVSHISDKGYLYFTAIGGHDPSIVIGQRVLVHTSEHGSMPGVIGKKPVHLMEDDERGKKLALHDMFIDVGATGRDAVAQKVSVGDPITYSAMFEHLNGDLAVAHAFDNKIGAFVVGETIRLLCAQDRRQLLKAAVYGVSTVQEEVGLRGAKTASHVTQATVGIAIDVGHAADYPGVDKRRVGDIELGRGPILTRGANINPEVFKMLIETAQAEGISVQYDAAGRGTGTDANVMQLNQGGMATAVVSVPLRYMHTPCEVVSLSDIHDTARLLAAFILRVDSQTDFTPTLKNLRPPKFVAPDNKPAAKQDAEPES